MNNFEFLIRTVNVVAPYKSIYLILTIETNTHEPLYLFASFW